MIGGWIVRLLVIAMLVAMSAPAAADSPVEKEAANLLVLLRLPAPHFRAGSDYGGAYGDGASRTARRKIAEQIARRHGLTMVDDWPMPLVGVDCFVMAVPTGRSVKEMADTLSSDNRVSWAQPVGIFEARSAATGRGDPLMKAQPAASEWQLARLHRHASGRGVRVAIVDSQVQADHPDLAGQVLAGANFVAGRARGAERHGTAVAGIVAARADNGVGIIGVAPAARLLALRACWQTDRADRTVCDSFSLAKAVYFAVENGAHVINMSLGGPPDRLLAKLIDVATARGISVVAAHDAALPGGGFPASHRGVVAVDDDVRAPLRPGVYIAPGQGVPTAMAQGGWTLVNGSSYSTAHVSGLIALMRENRRGRASSRLVANGSNGGAIDSCATVLRSSETCAGANARSAGLRR